LLSREDVGVRNNKIFFGYQPL